MKLQYSKPELVELGHVSELSATNDSVYQTDVPNGTPGSPNLPGGGILGSN
jgi:hypothetical protein